MMKARYFIGLAPGIVLALAAAGAHAQVDGTLFTQPDEREYLDYLREEFLRNNAEEGFDIEETAIPEIPAGAEATAPSGPTELSFGGIMTRRDASRSVWLNGRLLEENELPDGISLLNGERTPSLRIAFDGKVYVLRPGQTADLTTGNVVENFQRSAPAPAGALAAPPTAAPADTTAVTATVAAEGASAEAAEVAPSSTTQDAAAAVQDDADPVSPLAAAIQRLTPEQSNELAARLNDQAEAANTQPESENDDAED